MRRTPFLVLSCCLLLGCVRSAAHAAVVIDSLPTGVDVPAFLPAGSYSRGLTFTTGNASTHITDLQVVIDASGYDVGVPFSFTAGLYAASGGMPVGSLLASTTFDVVGLSGVNLVSPASLGTLGTYSMNAATQYSLAFFGATTNGYFLGGNASSLGTTSDGFVVNNGLFGLNPNSSFMWWPDSTVPAIRMSVPSSASVPEIDPAAIGCVVSLVTAALGLLERRRLKRA